MSEKPEDGVVDRWGRAHDVPNLFISDGSVMTTGAAANPTLTIVALAMRQADHILSELKALQPSRTLLNNAVPSEDVPGVMSRGPKIWRSYRAYGPRSGARGSPDRARRSRGMIGQQGSGSQK